jgi:hypothetical protein
MIPTNILDCLRPGKRVAIFSRGGELDFLVHDDWESAGRLAEFAAHADCDVLATHLKDRRSILRLVSLHDYDLGGEG